MKDHAAHQGASIDALYALHFDQALQVLSESFRSWNQYSYEPRVFKSLLYNGSSKVGERFDRILDIFSECAKQEKDFELRERFVLPSSQLSYNYLLAF